MICEYCGKEHNGNYGSGRFCSKNCCSAFNIKNNQYKGGRKGNGGWICPHCGIEFESRQLLQKHKKESNYNYKNPIAENSICPFCGKT